MSMHILNAPYNPSSPSSSHEFVKLFKSVTKSEWLFQTQTILALAGLSLNDDVTSKDCLVSKDSQAHNYGSNTLSEFITNPAAKHGLRLSWDDWCRNVTALKYKFNFHISGASSGEIIDKVTPVIELLGRTPVSHKEYEFASNITLKTSVSVAGDSKDSSEILQNKYNLLKSDYSDLESRMKSRVSRLNKSLRAKTQEADRLVREEQATTARISEELVNTKKAMIYKCNRVSAQLVKEKLLTGELLMKLQSAETDLASAKDLIFTTSVQLQEKDRLLNSNSVKFSLLEQQVDLMESLYINPNGEAGLAESAQYEVKIVLLEDKLRGLSALNEDQQNKFNRLRARVTRLRSALNLQDKTLSVVTSRHKKSGKAVVMALCISAGISLSCALFYLTIFKGI